MGQREVNWNEVVRRLAELRTQTELAELLGRSRSQINRYVRGKSVPSVEVINRLIQLAPDDVLAAIRLTNGHPQGEGGAA